MTTLPKVREGNGKWNIGATTGHKKGNWVKESSEFKKLSIKLSYASSYDLDLKVFEKPRNVYIKVGDNNLSLPYQLTHILEAINKSKEILSLDNDWDDEGANATNFKTYFKAITFVVNYSKYILETLKTVIDSPDIDIMRDGGVSVFWETAKATFLIIFKKNDTPYSYYYGNNKIDDVPFKYAIKNEGEVDQITAKWMCENLT